MKSLFPRFDRLTIFGMLGWLLGPLGAYLGYNFMHRQQELVDVICGGIHYQGFWIMVGRINALFRSDCTDVYQYKSGFILYVTAAMGLVLGIGFTMVLYHLYCRRYPVKPVS